VIQEISHLTINNVFPVLNSILNDLSVNFFLISAVIFLEIDVGKIWGDRFLCDRDSCLIIEKVIFEAAMATTKDLLQYVAKFKSTLQDCNVLIN
jgi:hypothetical protein